MGKIRIISRAKVEDLPIRGLAFYVRSAGANQSRDGWKEYFAAGSKPFVQIFWTERGCGEIVLNGETVRLRAGDFFYHLPQDEHAHRTVGECWDYRWFTLDGPLAEPFMLNYGYRQEPRYAGTCPAGLFMELERLLLKKDDYSGRYAVAVAAEILALAGRTELHAEQDPVEYFFASVEKKLQQPSFSAENIAGELGIHRTTFTRLFKEKTSGMTPGNYLREARICRALQLLQNTAMPVKEIAGKCGFSNSSYLCRLILERTGSTPKEYRSKKHIHAKGDEIHNARSDRRA